MKKVKFCDILEYEQPSKYIVESDQYKDEYKTPVLTAGKSFILGYTNETEGIYHATKDNPIILFDDFTTDCRYIDFNFKVKSSAVKILKLKRNDNNLKYLYYSLKNIVYDTSSHKRYWISQYSKFEVKLPNIEMQNEIVKEMEKIEDLIENKEKQMRKFDELVKSQFVEMFENEKNEEILNNVCKFINGDRGKNYPSAGEFVESGIPFINAGLIKEKKVNWEEMNYITEEKYNKLGSGKIQKDDVLYCLRGSLGKHCIIDLERKGAIASSLVILRANKEKILPEYLLNILDTDEIIMQQKQANNGSSQPNLSAGSVKNYKIKLPNIKRQEEFVNIVKQIDKQKEVCNKIIDKLNELKKDKMQEYFGGVINE